MKKVLGIIVKLILSILAGIYIFLNADILNAIIYGGICYGLLSYIQWIVSKREGSRISIKSLILSVLGAVVLLSLFTIAMNSILPNGIGGKIAAFLVIVMCIGFCVKDIKIIIQFFKKDKGNGEREGR